MKKLIVPFIEGLKSNDKIQSFDEASIKQAVVMKLLSLLGWDIFDVDEVAPDYSDKSFHVDYSLMIDRKNKVFIQVKKPEDDLTDDLNGLLDFASKKKGAPFHINKRNKMAVLSLCHRWNP